MEQLEKVTQSSASPEQKIKDYVSVLQNIPRVPGNEGALLDYIKYVVDIAYSRNTTKPVVAAFVDYASDESADAEFRYNVLAKTVELLSGMLVAYEEEEMAARGKLADVLVLQEEYQQAARVLLEGLSSTERRLLTDDVKFDSYVRIVRCYLETDQPELAEAPLSRAQHARPYVTNVSPETDLHFKLSQARIFDANRKFLEASNKYHVISRESIVTDDDRLQCLKQAIVCAILSPAGPLRSQALRRLYNDERCQQLSEFGILEKVHLDRLLLQGDIADFEKELQPHQKALTADGTTVLTRAVIEHNVMAVSKIYNNIGIPELGKFLGLEKDKAEQYAAKMITQNRLAAKIDQVEGLIYFKSHYDTETATNNDYDYASGNAHGNGIVLLKQLDGDIQDLCNELEGIITELHKTHPEFVESRLAV